MLTEYTTDNEREELAKRYPMSERGRSMCDSHNDGWKCTREKGHQPPHVAHGSYEEAFAEWSDG